MSADHPFYHNRFPPLAFTDRAGGRDGLPRRDLQQIHEEICQAADLPLSQARTLPAQAYTSEDFFDWETKHLLRCDWQCVAHVSQLPLAGDFINVDLLGEPLLVVRGKDQFVRVLSRVCPHRSMDIMPAGFGYDGHGPATARSGGSNCGHTRLLLCPYHSWTFELDGKLKACPEMHRAEEFHRDSHALKVFRSTLWQGFVFVNLDGEAPEFEDGLAEMEKDLAAFRLETMTVACGQEWDCSFNWKVLVENFMESYHHLGIHHRTLQPMMPARDTWTEEAKGRYIRAHLPYNEATRKALEETPQQSQAPALPGLDVRQRSEWGLFLIPPTFLLATAPDRVIWYRLHPLGPNRLQLLTTALLAPAAIPPHAYDTVLGGVQDSLTEFHLEDMEVCTAVQRGFYASGWRPGRLSHLEMPVWMIERYLAARIRGTWPAWQNTRGAGTND